jgi:hypothetical protein
LDWVLESQGQTIHNMGFETGTDMDSGVDTDFREACSPDHTTQHLVVRSGHDIMCASAFFYIVQERWLFVTGVHNVAVGVTFIY